MYFSVNVDLSEPEEIMPVLSEPAYHDFRVILPAGYEDSPDRFITDELMDSLKISP